MPASRARRRPMPLLRWLLLALLAIGGAVQPLMAAACEIADLARAAAVDDGAVVAADPTDADARSPITGDAGDDCCASGNCVDCCLHAVAHPSAQVALAAAAFPAAPAALAPRAPPPRAFPVDDRPPIDG